MKSTTPNPTVESITALRGLQTRCEQFAARRAELERLSTERVTAFSLAPEACRAFSEIRAGIELAAASDTPLRVHARGVMSGAGGAASQCRDRISHLHSDIDATIREIVIASLPPELAGVEVVTKQAPAISHFGAAISGTKSSTVIHIGSSKWGKQELAERLDPENVQLAAYFDQQITVLDLAKKIAELANGMERLVQEEARAGDALARLRKIAPKQAAVDRVGSAAA